MATQRMSSSAAIIGGLADSEGALVEHLRVGSAAGRLDPHARARLPGWSVGQILAALTQNADSLRQTLVGDPPSDNQRGPGDGPVGNNIDRPVDELIDELERAGGALLAALRATEPASASNTPVAQTPVSEVSLSGVALTRWRAVEIHRVDLDLGYELTDMPGLYVRHDLRALEMVFNSRLPMGLSRLPQAVLSVPPAVRLGWLLGRVEIDNVAPAHIELGPGWP